MHIVSKVSGILRQEKFPYDALRSVRHAWLSFPTWCLLILSGAILQVFPAGTVSGAPKIRAMQLVAGLEKVKRSIYAGAVGYFGFDGTMDMCIAIRTMVRCCAAETPRLSG
jgi:anthranilate synthase component 1